MVNAFLKDLEQKLTAGGAKEVEKPKDIKRKDVKSCEEIFDNKYFLWDHPYYERMVLETEYSVDYQKLRNTILRRRILMGCSTFPRNCLVSISKE